MCIRDSLKWARRTALFSGIAVAATGLAFGSSVFVQDEAPADTAASVIEAAEEERKNGSRPSAAGDQRRSESTSRSDRRTASVSGKEEDGRATSAERLRARAETIAAKDLREIARDLMPEYGLSPSGFGCLDALWVSESDWEVDADNPTSSAYGIPQALTSMYDLPDDYMTNPVSQIEWGLWYINDSYGTACSAWEFKQANNFY